MNNILSYLDWRGDITMDIRPFNEVDSVILSRISYLPFEHIVTEKFDEYISLKEAADIFFNSMDAMKKADSNADMALLKRMSASSRFDSLRLCGYVAESDEDIEKQFSALSVILPDGCCYISYRGTDGTLLGWKEDFNMTFRCPVPSQEAAVSYLNRASDYFTGQLITGGHSKGGNLAVFASSFCNEEIKERISAIYNFDGPGFDNKVIETDGYRNICNKVVTFVPQSSVIGMMLEHEEPYAIIRSFEKTGMMQHNVYSWTVDRDHFHRVKEVDKRSTFIDFTLKEWVGKMSPAQREAFVDTAYHILTQNGEKTINDMSRSYIVRLTKFIYSMRDLDEDDRKKVTDAILLLVDSARDGLKKVVF